MSRFRSKNAGKKLSESIKINKICDVMCGHVDGMKK